MRRSMIPLTVLAVGLLGLVAAADIGSSIAAQEATPAPLAGHPFVGAWRMINTAFPADAPILVVLHADGTYLQTEADGSVGIGSWAETGERSAAVTFVEHFVDDQGAANTITFRAVGEVTAGGDAFTGTYTIELVGPDGTSGGEYGPGTVQATRIAVEPMGTPVGPLEELFAQFEQGGPEATSAP